MLFFRKRDFCMSIFDRFKRSRFWPSKVFAQSALFSPFFRVLGWKPAADQVKLIKKIRGWSYTCINLNAQACAQVPLRLYKIKSKSSTSKIKSIPIGREKRKYLQTKLAERLSSADEIEEVTEHEIIDLLRRVNPCQNSFELKDVTVRYLEAIGVAYWYLERGIGNNPDGSKKIINIWPLYSQYMQIFPDTDNGIKMYKYGRTINKVELDPNDVVHFQYTSLTEFFVGDSPLKAAEQSVDLNEAMNVCEISSFKNGGNPNVVMEVPSDGFLPPDERKRIESEWKRKYTGAAKTGKMVITSGGANLKEFGFKPKDMSYLQGRKTVLEETCGAFGVPLVFVKPDQVSRANLWGSLDWWMKFTINPKLTRIEQKLNEKFTPNWGDDLFLLFDDPRPDDPELRLKQIQALLTTKYSSINEQRAIDGLEPVEWGEEPIVTDIIDNQEEEKPDQDIEKQVKREGQSNDLPEPDLMPMIFRARLFVLFKEMEGVVAKNLDNYGKSKAIEPDPSDAAFFTSADDVTSAVFDTAFWGKRISVDSMPFIEGLLSMALFEEAEKTNPEGFVNPSSITIQRSLEERSQSIKSTATTVEKEIRGDIADSIAAGESKSQTIKRVRGNFNARFKADRVVRTETIWAHNEGTLEAWKQSGVVRGKKWDTVPDDRRCPYCASMHGKTIGIDSTYFEKGTDLTVDSPDSGNPITLKFSYESVKHPPLHPSCRCQLIPIIEDV